MNVTVCGLWAKQKRYEDGSVLEYEAGKTGPVTIPAGTHVAVFPNKNKTSDNQPDAFLIVSDPPKPKEESKAAPQSDRKSYSDIPF